MDARRFDEEGFPTHDAEGAPLDAKAQAKGRQAIEKQAKLRLPLTKALDADPEALTKLQAEIVDLKELVAESSLLSNGSLSMGSSTP